MFLLVSLVLITFGSIFMWKWEKRNWLFLGYHNILALYNKFPTYFLPPMSFKRIVSLLDVPELNIEQVIVSGDEVYRMDIDEHNEHSKKFLLTYYSRNKKNTKDVRTNEFFKTINLSGCIFIIPENSEEYKKLCDYYLSSNKFRKDMNIQTSQLNNLREIQSKLSKINEKDKEIIDGCLDRAKEWSYIR